MAACAAASSGNTKTCRETKDCAAPSMACCSSVEKTSAPPKSAGPSPCSSRNRSETKAMRRRSFMGRLDQCQPYRKPVCNANHITVRLKAASGHPWQLPGPSRHYPVDGHGMASDEDLIAEM